MKKYTLVVGIDVSKSVLDLSNYGAGKSSHIKVKNDSSGFIQLTDWLEKIADSKKVLFCMEHTGIYTFPLCCFLAKHGLNYTLIPASQIKKSLGIQRGKNDRADAKAIARYGYLFQDELIIHTLPEKTLMKLKILISYRERLINTKRVFQVSAGELKQFSDPSLSGFVIRNSEAVLKQIKKKIQQVDKQIEQVVQKDPSIKETYNLCISVPGIGPQIATYLLVSTRCFKAFKGWRQYACYSGVAPFEFRSGSSIRGRTKVSHLANKKAKSLLSMGAINAIRYDRELNAYYQRKVKEGKNKLLVINAVRNKLLARVFATVKRGSPFIQIANY